ncbi:MAG TPA: DUF2846 domain-containing protein [Caulobacteraceae bacterium]|jgi:hypothetical protein
MLSRRTLLVLAGTTLAFDARAAPAAQPIDVGDPPPGKALIVFYRKRDYPGSANTYAVREGVAQLGDLGIGTYFVVAVDPGLHTFNVHAERRSDMQLEVEAGETYFVRFVLETGWLLYQPTLEPSEKRLFDQTSVHLARSGAPERSVTPTK